MKPKKLEISKYGRLVVYEARSSTYGGKAGNSCMFSTVHEAIRWARFEARGFKNWDNFPDPALKYPDEERAGNEGLTPLFRALWADGRVEVFRREISDKFDWYAKNGVPDPQPWDLSQKEEGSACQR